MDPAHLWSRLSRNIEAATVLLLLLLAAALWAFFALASEMTEGDLTGFDKTLLLSLRTPGDPSDPIGGPALEQVMRDLTAVGGATVLILISVAVVVALLIRRHWRSALVLALAVAGGQILSHLAKSFFDRPRPDLVPHGVQVFSSSFPSGHSMMATITYLTLAVMLARVEPDRRMKVFYLVLAALLSLAVGVSRVYLGVHWPSDVLAGWAAGSAWALMVALIAEWLDPPVSAGPVGTNPSQPRYRR